MSNMSNNPHPPAADVGTGRSFTAKAVVVGVLLALVTVIGAWFNNEYLQQSTAIGSFIPPLPFGLILLLVLVWNPTIGRTPALRFSTRELAVVFSLTLLVSWIPTSGFLRYFQRSVVGPQLQADNRPIWRKNDVIGHLPQGMFPLGGAPEVAALTGAITAEREALASDGLSGVLAEAGVEPATYAAALDLADLVPRRQWRDLDRKLVRENTVRAWQRGMADDPARWQGVEGLLAAMPRELTLEAGTPAAWRLAHLRITATFDQRIGPARADYERVYTGMNQGLPVSDETLPLSATPFAAWVPALLYWMPLVLLMTLAVFMLQLIVHRQWAHHEQLSYPIARLATVVIERQPDALVSDIFRNRLFWFGAIPVLAIHLLNYLAAWFPGWLPVVPLSWSNVGAVHELFPSIGQAGGASSLGTGAIYFVIIGLAFFISAEVSLSMGIAGLMVVLFNVQWYAATGTTSHLESSRMGAFLGYAVLLLYTGRTYYWAVARRAFGRAGGAAGEHSEPVWAARVFLLAFAGFIIVLVGAFGLDWLVAVAYALTLMIVFLVVTRVVCETGMPFVMASWQPATLMTSLLGVGAIGAAPLVLISYLGAVLSWDTSESAMPFAATSLKMADDTGVRRSRLAWIGMGVVGVALVVGICASLWGLYNFGSSRDAWAQRVASMQLDTAAVGLTELTETGQYADSTQAVGLAKIPLIADNVTAGRHLSWITFGFLAVLSFALIRFRWPGFYLHPVLFLIWDTYAVWQVWTSFLLGYLAKTLIMRFGGGRAYQGLKPLFIGLILGELGAAILSLMTGWIYHWCTGLMPKTTWIFSV